MESFKQMTLSDDLYYKNDMEDFARQLDLAFRSKENGFNLFQSEYQLVIMCLVEIFIKGNRESSFHLASYFSLDFDSIIKNAKPKNLIKINAFILDQMIYLTTEVKRNKAFMASNDYNANQKHLFEFMRCIVNHIRQIVDKQFGKSTLKLTQNILEFQPSNENFYLLCDLLNKSKGFQISELTTEFNDLILLTIKQIYAIYFNESVDDEVKQVRKEAYNLFGKFEKFLNVLNYDYRLSSSKPFIAQLQPLVVEWIVYKPIEQLDQCLNFECFLSLINRCLKSFLNFDVHPNDAKSLDRFRSVLEISIKRFDLTQTSNESFNKSFSEIFRSIYLKLFESFEKRSDHESALNEPLIQLLNRVHQLDSYFDEERSFEKTFNYTIVDYLSRYLLTKSTTNESLVRRLIQIWIDLFKSHPNELTSDFFTSIESVCRVNPKILAEKSKEFWDFFFETDNMRFLSIIHYILPFSIGDFDSSRIDLRFHAACMKAECDPATIGNFSLVLNKLSQLHPIYYFKSIDSSSTKFIYFDLASKFLSNGTNRTVVVLIYCALDLACDQYVRLDREKVIQKKVDLKKLFDARKEILRILFDDPKASKRRLLADLFPGVMYLDRQLFLIAQFYCSFVLVDPTRTRYEMILDDLLDLVTDLDGRKECSLVLNQLKEMTNRVEEMNHDNLLKPNVNKLKQLKERGVSSTEVRDTLDEMIFKCQEITIENINAKLSENISKVHLIDSTVNDADKKLNALDKNLIEQSSQFKQLSTNLSSFTRKLDHVDTKVEEQAKKIEQIDEKTLLNVPLWSKKLIKALESEDPKWMRLISKRMNFSELDIKSWLQQPDPLMSMLNEWYTINKTSDATNGLLKILKEFNLVECVRLVEENITYSSIPSNDSNDDANDEKEVKGAQVFLSFEWSCFDKAALLAKYLRANNVDVCMETEKEEEILAGSSRFKRVDLLLRRAHVFVCFVTRQFADNSTCLGLINLAVQLGKPIIPLLMDASLKWPPSGSLGPILSEYLFIRFYQRQNELLINDERYWPVDKFNELLMQLRQIVPPSDFSSVSSGQQQKKIQNETDIFISYQWDKQREIKQLFGKLSNELGLKCWLDINEMGGGDSLYEKIDSGLRNTSVMIACVTLKYALSANCRKEMALAASINKPIVPIVLDESVKWPPNGPMSPILGELEFIDFTANYSLIKQQNNQTKDPFDIWFGECYEKLLAKLKPHLSENTVNRIRNSRACVIS